MLMLFIRALTLWRFGKIHPGLVIIMSTHILESSPALYVSYVMSAVVVKYVKVVYVVSIWSHAMFAVKVARIAAFATAALSLTVRG